MTTRVQATGPQAKVLSDQTAPRVTPPPARPFRSVLDAGASAVVSSAESATRHLPGGPILAAALRSTPTEPPALVSPEGSTGTASSSVDSLGTQVDDSPLYFLELQQQISAESNAYAALSNVLKARHETIKNAIGNIR